METVFWANHQGTYETVGGSPTDGTSTHIITPGEFKGGWAYGYSYLYNGVAVGGIDTDVLAATTARGETCYLVELITWPLTGPALGMAHVKVAFSTGRVRVFPEEQNKIVISGPGFTLTHNNLTPSNGYIVTNLPVDHPLVVALNSVGVPFQLQVSCSGWRHDDGVS